MVSDTVVMLYDNDNLFWVVHSTLCCLQHLGFPPLGIRDLRVGLNIGSKSAQGILDYQHFNQLFLHSSYNSWFIGYKITNPCHLFFKTLIIDCYWEYLKYPRQEKMFETKLKIIQHLLTILYIETKG